MARPLLIAALLAVSASTARTQAEDAPAESKENVFSIRKLEGGLEVRHGVHPIAEYMLPDEQTLRPSIRHLRTPSGIQLTRNHPPRKGEDLDDHPTMHPGLWLAFGDLNGADFWRNKGRVRHLGFIDEPKDGTISVRSAYEVEGKPIAIEECRLRFVSAPGGYLLKWTSVFRSDEGALEFGDQEEMGLGLRVATPIAVKYGGRITNSEGRVNEKDVWGRQADWCRYGGTRDGRSVGVVLMPGQKNFLRSWFHARDYGLLVANPFGQRAFTRGEKGVVRVKKGEELRLQFAVLVYELPEGKEPDITAAIRASDKE